MTQTIYYPELTAINRKAPSFPTKWLLQSNLIKGTTLDFGSGKGKDYQHLKQQGVKCEEYDSYYAPYFPRKQYDTIICHYVLNVVDRMKQTSILAEVSYLLKQNGIAYFTVRRDLKKEGIRIHAIYKKPTYQCNVTLPFKSIFKNKHCEIYKYQKPNDPNIILESISIQVKKVDNELHFFGKESNSYHKLSKREITAKEILQQTIKKRIL